MSKKITPFNFLGSIFLVLMTIAGCAATAPRPSGQRARSLEPLPPPRTGQPLPPPANAIPAPSAAAEQYALPDHTAALVADRLRIYEQRRAEWDNIEKEYASFSSAPPDSQELRNRCRERVDAVMEQYAAVGEERHSPELRFDKEEAAAFWMANQLDIAYLEGECPQILASQQAALTESRATATVLAARLAGAGVKGHLKAGRLDEALAAYSHVAATYPEEAKKPALQETYALILLQLGRFEEARPIFEELLAARAGEAACSPLGPLYADLLFALARYDEARTVYEDLHHSYAAQGLEDSWVSDKLNLLRSGPEHMTEINAYTGLLQLWLTFDGDRLPAAMRERVEYIESTFPDTIFSKSARDLLLAAESRARSWVGRSLATTGNSPEQKQLDGHPQDLSQKGTETGELDRQRTEAAEAEARQRQIEEALKSQWSEADRLLSLREYDQATAKFSQLLNTGYESQARAKMQEAMDLSAADKRKRAADLFVQARRTGDAEQRKEYLLSSHRLLQEIIEQHPQAAIINKVRQNMRALEEYMEQIDPGLLHAEEQVSPASDLHSTEEGLPAESTAW